AVDDVVAPVTDGGRLDAGDVRARVRLGESERAEDRLVDERREPLALLLLGAGEQDRRRTERVRHDRDRDPGAAPGKLLADQDPIEDREAQPAELFGDVD